MFFFVTLPRTPSCTLFPYTTLFRSQLRAVGIHAELYPDATKMKKQMMHADKRAIPFVILVGEEEMNSNTYTLKNMVSGEQFKLSLQDLISEIKMSPK